MNQLVYAINIYWAHENKIQTKTWISNSVGKAVKRFTGLIYSLNNAPKNYSKLKLRCLQWHNFLLKKVIFSIELWHKLTLIVSKKNPASSLTSDSYQSEHGAHEKKSP